MGVSKGVQRPVLKRDRCAVKVEARDGGPPGIVLESLCQPCRLLTGGNHTVLITQDRAGDVYDVEVVTRYEPQDLELDGATASNGQLAWKRVSKVLPPRRSPPYLYGTRVGRVPTAAAGFPTVVTTTVGMRLESGLATARREKRHVTLEYMIDLP